MLLLSRKRAARRVPVLARPLHSHREMEQWRGEQKGKRFRFAASIEVDAPIDEVFARWSRCEDFPKLMENVRRTKRIDERCVLWDVDILGRQVVWEARILENAPPKRIRWASSWGAPNAGQVDFEALPDGRTRLTVEIEYEPRGVVERLGAYLGVLDLHVQRDLARFRRALEAKPAVSERA